MTSSLVGSEMCIRDRLKTLTPRRPVPTVAALLARLVPHAAGAPTRRPLLQRCNGAKRRRT
eukprot:8324820-Prorocentrum_lima.AAC.1